MEPWTSSLRLKLSNGNPARQHDVDEHERVVAGEMNVAVVRGVVGTVPGQVDPLPADAQRVAGVERDVGHGPGRVVLLGQQPPGLSLADPGHVPAEQ